MSADDVTDLEHAQQIITHLRATIVRLDEESRPIEGEYSIFLDEAYDRKLQLLFKTRQLYIGQDAEPDIELDEAATEFVKQAIDLAWDNARIDGEQPGPWVTTTA